MALKVETHHAFFTRKATHATSRTLLYFVYKDLLINKRSLCSPPRRIIGRRAPFMSGCLETCDSGSLEAGSRQFQNQGTKRDIKNGPSLP